LWNDASQRVDYQQVDSLPNFRLFTWFFEVPGILIRRLALLASALVGVSDSFSLS